MRTFFFHLRTPAGLERDDVGLVFGSIEEAMLAAAETIPAVAGDLIGEGHALADCAYVIAGEDGVALADMPFGELERPRVGGAPACVADLPRPAERGGGWPAVGGRLLADVSHCRRLIENSRALVEKSRSLTQASVRQCNEGWSTLRLGHRYR